MNDSQRALFLKIIGGFVRAAIIGAGAWLKATGKLPAVDVDSWIGQLAAMSPSIAGDILMAAGALWSALQKWWSHRQQRPAVVSET